MFAALNSHIDEFTLSVEILYKYLTQVDDIVVLSHLFVLIKNYKACINCLLKVVKKSS